MKWCFIPKNEFNCSTINASLNKKGQTPLHIALEKNSKEMLELLISKGANINAIDIFHRNIIL